MPGPVQRVRQFAQEFAMSFKSTKAIMAKNKMSSAHSVSSAPTGKSTSSAQKTQTTGPSRMSFSSDETEPLLISGTPVGKSAPAVKKSAGKIAKEIGKFFKTFAKELEKNMALTRSANAFTQSLRANPHSEAFSNVIQKYQNPETAFDPNDTETFTAYFSQDERGVGTEALAQLALHNPKAAGEIHAALIDKHFDVKQQIESLPKEQRDNPDEGTQALMNLRDNLESAKGQVLNKATEQFTRDSDKGVDALTQHLIANPDSKFGRALLKNLPEAMQEKVIDKVAAAILADDSLDLEALGAIATQHDTAIAEKVGEKFVEQIMSAPTLSTETKLNTLRAIPDQMLGDGAANAVLRDGEGNLRGEALAITKALVRDAIEGETGDALLRGNNMASKLLAGYLQENGKTWVQNIMGGIAEEMLAAEKEVDAQLQNVEKEIIKPLRQELERAIAASEKNQLSPEEAKVIIARHSAIKPEIAEKLVTVYLEISKENLGNVLSREEVVKLLKNDALESKSLELAGRIMDNFSDSLALNTQNPIPPDILELLKELKIAGNNNVDGRQGVGLNAQQQQTFRGFDFTTVILRSVNPALTNPEKYGMAKAWEGETPRVLVQVQNPLQFSANRVGSKENQDLKAKRERIETQLAVKYQTDWTIGDVFENKLLYGAMKAKFGNPDTGAPELFAFVEVFHSEVPATPQEAKEHYQAIFDTYLKKGVPDQLNISDQTPAGKAVKEMAELLAKNPFDTGAFKQQMDNLMNELSGDDMWAGMVKDLKSNPV